MDPLVPSSEVDAFSPDIQVVPQSMASLGMQSSEPRPGHRAISFAPGGFDLVPAIKVRCAAVPDTPETDRYTMSFRAMREPVLITTEFPSVEETAMLLGVSPSRTRELIRRAEEIASRSLGPKAQLDASGRRAKKKNGAVKRRGDRTSPKN